MPPQDSGATSPSSPAAKSAPRRGARTAYAANAALAWGGFALVLALSVTGSFAATTAPGNVYGKAHPEGIAGAWSRGSDTLSYFTEWSNVVVAIACTLLAMSVTKDTFWRRVIRLDSLLMITITAIVYAVLLAPTEVIEGWSVITNPWQHIAVPLVTVLVWLIWGPRGWINARVVLASMLIPLAWIVWMLIRGALVGSYPYGFLDAATHGWPSVLTTLGGILIFGVLLALTFWGLDGALTRVAPTPASTHQTR